MTHLNKNPFLLALATMILLAACASIGNPDGGRYDETPPYMVSSTPMLGALNASQKKITLHFNEYIKLENANEKVVYSPTQTEMPEIKVSGKRIDITLFDSLQQNTTYTVDFSDAIVDNNEGNPMGNFTFSFATGASLDTLEVSGTVLDAENHEPIKGIMVGLHSIHADSAFTTIPLQRVSRTNGSGRFTIKGVKPGEYRIYALADANGNMIFDQKSEKIAFTSELIVPSFKPDMRADTLWVDSTRIDTIITTPYTRFLPDNIVLSAFTELNTHQYLVKAERELPTTFTLYFGARSDTLPTIKGLNFNEMEAFVLEASVYNDTLKYWIKDSTIFHLDTLFMELSYLETDSTNQLAMRTDTLELSPKTTRAQLQKALEKKIEDWEKEQKKAQKKSIEGEDAPLLPYPKEMLEVKILNTGGIAPNQNITLEFSEPIALFDTLGVRLNLKVDSLWEAAPFYIENIDNHPRKYRLYGEWKPDDKFQFEIDSAAFIGIYNHEINDKKSDISVKGLDDFSTLYLTLPDAEPNMIAQLLDSSDKVAYSTAVSPKGLAQFFFIKPGKYYVRAFVDRNQDGVWTTGEFESNRTPETVYYYTKSLDLKAAWEIRQEWRISDTPLEKQKPREIVKQKPDSEKKIKSRNEERDLEKKKR